MTSNVPGSPIPDSYGQAKGSSLEQGLGLHKVYGQPGGAGDSQPGENDTFGVESLQGVGAARAKREVLSADAQRSAAPPSGPLRGTISADHGDSE